VDFVNLKHPDDRVGFSTAVQRGLGRDQGLYFPESITPRSDINELLRLPFVERSALLLAHLTGMAEATTLALVRRAFDFPIEQPQLCDGSYALELFHGPSLAFKDFGARFLAACLAEFTDGSPTTILTATSGDTGAAVAHAFHGIEGVRAVILYPAGRISPLQEKLFCTLGGNIDTVSVNADFDSCQALVKQAFDDPALRERLGLNSANSINVARLLAQVCYYFESVARLEGAAPVFSVPSGNFGNVTACLVARAVGLPIGRVLAATNRNDILTRFVDTGVYAKGEVYHTLSPAMDIQIASNFERYLYYLLDEDAGAVRTLLAEMDQTGCMQVDGERLTRVQADFHARAVTDPETLTQIRETYDASGYTLCPHTAVGARASADQPDAVVLATAHPAKFNEAVREAIGSEAAPPPSLQGLMDKPTRCTELEAESAAVREHIRTSLALV